MSESFTVVSPVAPSAALLSTIVSRAVGAVAAEIDRDAVVERAADLVVEAATADVVADVDLDRVIARAADAVQGRIDVSDVVEALDLGDIASDVANEIDLWSLANEIDVSDVASNLSMGDLADEVFQRLDLDDLASRVTLPPRTLERVERLEERLAALEEAEPVAAPARISAMDAAIDLHRERLVALEERLAPAPATPAAPAALPVTGDVLDAVLGRTVDALLAALNAAAAEGRL